MESGLASKKLPVFCVVRDSESDDGTDSASPGKCSGLPSHAFTPGHRHIRTPISGVCESYRSPRQEALGPDSVPDPDSVPPVTDLEQILLLFQISLS